MVEKSLFNTVLLSFNHLRVGVGCCIKGKGENGKEGLKKEKRDIEIKGTRDIQHKKREYLTLGGGFFTWGQKE